MTLVDSADSVLMLYSYAGFPERSLALFERVIVDESEKSSLVGAGSGSTPISESPTNVAEGDPDAKDTAKGAFPGDGIGTSAQVIEGIAELPDQPQDGVRTRTPSPDAIVQDTALSQEVKRNLLIKENTMSGLSIVLTLISILVAFRYGSFHNSSGEGRRH